MRIPFNKIENKYDLIIVGAGITGLTILDRFLEKKIKSKILLLEVGSMLSRNPYPTNFEILSKNLKIKETSRFFGVGGGSNVWQPTHGLFDKNRINHYFQKYQFPINYKKYLKYINIAAEKYKTPYHQKFHKYHKGYKNFKSRTLITNNTNINFFNFSSLLESDKVDFAENVKVKNLSFDDNIDKIIIQSQKSGKTIKILGKKIILSVGTLECLRILHKSFKNKPKTLGKGFMNHPRGFVGFFKSKKKIIIDNNRKKSIKFSFNTGLQLKHKGKQNSYVSISKGIHFAILYKLSSFFQTKISFSRNKYFLNFFLRILNKLLTILNNVIVNITSNNYSSLIIFCEMEKNDRNVVKLNENKLTVDYKLSRNDKDSVIELLKKFEIEFKVKIFPDINYKNITNNINFDTSHHMGGVSMGKDETFLVNSKSKLKASNSTFISGGACFNFSDSVNPTLTYIALSLHLADQIFKEYFEKN